MDDNSVNAILIAGKITQLVIEKEKLFETDNGNQSGDIGSASKNIQYAKGW